MMRRPHGADFAPGAYVFPGGSAHPEDAEFPDQPRAAAARELFEELGILLARLPNGRFAAAGDCRRLREALENGSPWTEAVRSLRLTLALDRLAYLTRWITPEAVRRRFDTYFFLCKLPAGQTEHPHPGEVADWMWVTPSEALGLDLVFATRRILEQLSDEPDASALIRKVRRRRPGPVVIPRIVEGNAGPEPVAQFYDPETLLPWSGRSYEGQRQASRQRS
jgi:recombination protein RecT